MSALTELAEYVKAQTATTPETVEAPPIVDLHFFRVVVAETFETEKFVALTESALREPGEFQDLTVHDLKQGPSYVALGAWIGDQSMAMRFMACGQIAGVWTVITPKTFGVDGPEADSMAGAGYVMLSGYKP